MTQLARQLDIDMMAKLGHLYTIPIRLSAYLIDGHPSCITAIEKTGSIYIPFSYNNYNIKIKKEKIMYILRLIFVKNKN